MKLVEFKVSGNAVRGLEGEVELYREFVLQQEFDVLVIKAAQQWTFDALIPVLDRITKPKVFIPCGFSLLHEPSYAEYFRVMPRWLRSFDRLIFYASRYRDINMAREHGLTNICVIPNGADEREFVLPRDAAFRHRLGIAKDAFVVLTVGALNGLKGHLEVARAFAKADFGGRPAFLLLNGNSPHRSMIAKSIMTRTVESYRKGGLRHVLRKALRELAPAEPPVEANPLDDVLKVIRSRRDRSAVVCDLPRSELVQAYLNSDLFVFASKVEYSPLVLYEASAAGLPFISSPAGNAAEIAEWTQAGVICPSSQDGLGYMHVDIDTLSEQISSIANDPKKLEELGYLGRLNWEQRFTWEKIARLYESLLNECVSSGGPTQKVKPC